MLPLSQNLRNQGKNQFTAIYSDSKASSGNTHTHTGTIFSMNKTKPCPNLQLFEPYIDLYLT